MSEPREELNGGDSGEVSREPDIDALIQEVLRLSYLETVEDLQYYAEKVRRLNEKKRAVRAYLAKLREFDGAMFRATRQAGISPYNPDATDLAATSKLFSEHVGVHSSPQTRYEFRVPDRVPPPGVASFDDLETEIQKWERALARVGEEVQLACVDLQNMLQKQQQTMQMMSTISKMLHDTAMTVIRKIGG
jgi:hypothetical protein